eukprot:947612-Amphidinium_carterae.1
MEVLRAKHYQFSESGPVYHHLINLQGVGCRAIEKLAHVRAMASAAFCGQVVRVPSPSHSIACTLLARTCVFDHPLCKCRVGSQTLGGFSQSIHNKTGHKCWQQLS